MNSPHLGILHPGEMGARVGAVARAVGTPVSWASSGRSDASRRRATEAGLDDKQDLQRLAAVCDVILSVCPPEAAVAQAEKVAATGFVGIFVDANAVASTTAAAVGKIVTETGARYVDGGIIGPPPLRAGTTRLYLSGEDAGAVAALFGGSMLEAIVVGPHPGAASALKMCYAAWTKGSAAMLTAIRALAQGLGVEAALLAEWQLSQPGLEDRSVAAARNNAFKAWRFAGEMREIAATFEAARLPGGFHEAAAEIYARLADYKDCETTPELAEIIATLLAERS